jgi:hypothetical protein
MSALLANLTRFERNSTPMNSAVRMTDWMLCVMMKKVAPVSFCAVTTNSSR